MTDPLPYMKRPCPECPRRLDALPGRFAACRYDALRETAGSAGSEVPIGGPMFACHKTREGADMACAGWLATVGHEHIGVRFAIVTGRLPAEALERGDDWPALFGSYEEMAASNGAASGRSPDNGAAGRARGPARTTVALVPRAAPVTIPAPPRGAPTFPITPARCCRCLTDPGSTNPSGLLADCDGHRT